MKTVGDLRPFKIGDRFRAENPAGWHWRGLLEVARIEDRGVVCDLIIGGINKGHRSLYEWHEKWQVLERV